MHSPPSIAHVAELADACVSEAHGETRGGSSPLVSTKFRFWILDFGFWILDFLSAPTSPTHRQQDPQFIRRTFATIARRYDLANHALSFGVDFLWRARAATIVKSWA